jgi:hypothetical protein
LPARPGRRCRAHRRRQVGDRVGGTGEPTRGSSASRRRRSAVVIAVVVEHGGRGAARAAPIAGSLLAAWKAWAGQ